MKEINITLQIKSLSGLSPQIQLWGENSVYLEIYFESSKKQTTYITLGTGFNFIYLSEKSQQINQSFNLKQNIGGTLEIWMRSASTKNLLGSTEISFGMLDLTNGLDICSFLKLHNVVISNLHLNLSVTSQCIDKQVILEKDEDILKKVESTENQITPEEMERQRLQDITDQEARLNAIKKSNITITNKKNLDTPYF